MEKIISDSINKATDDAMKEFLNDPQTIFNDKKEQLKFMFATMNELKKWKKNKNCIVKGCKNKSIENSHTIQRSGSIKNISENGHVLTPQFNHNNGKIEIFKIGVNEASTFPGYCTEHEKLFNEFEHAKEFENSEHMGLQLYRTVCREIVISENHLKELDHYFDRYKTFRDKKIGESIINKLDPVILNTPTLEFKSFKITSNDYRLRDAAKHKKELLRYLNEFLYKYHDAILHDLRNKKFSKIAYVAVAFDREIPVALAGRGNFKLKLKTKFKDIEVIFNVLPMINKTYIFISTLKRNEVELKHYMEHFINPLQFVCMIESWMIHGSDHWFIKPSIWKKIDSKYQTEILNEILDIKFNIADELKLSIFNNLKSEFIKLMESNYEKLNDQHIQLLNKEKSKLTFILL